MARRNRKNGSGRGFFKALLYVFAVIGLLTAVLGTYQYKKITALYRMADILSTARKVHMQMVLDREALGKRGITPGEAHRDLKSAFSELGIDADVKTEE